MIPTAHDMEHLLYRLQSPKKNRIFAPANSSREMKFYNDDNEEDSFSEDEIALANSFCEACDKGIAMVFDEEEYDIIISNLMFSQKSDYLKKAIERAQNDFPDDPGFVIWKM